MSRLLATLVLVLGFAVPAAAAQAAPPANDNRDKAQTLNPLPQTVHGTTVDATTEPNEPGSCVGPTGGSVWYQLPAGDRRELVLELDAAGDLDAVVDVYRRDRSQLTPLDCAQTSRKGHATLDFTQAKDATLLLRVAPRANSAQDAFTLRVVQPDAPERPPGHALRPSGASSTVDRIADPDDAYAVRMQPGRSYRVHLVSKQRCVRAGLYAPGTSSFEDSSPVRSFGCDQYFLYTPGPGEGGRYSVRVRAPAGVRGALPYHVQVAPAGTDDTAPGVPLPNDTRVHGALRGSGDDVIDLYRFDVTRRSILDLALKTGSDTPFDLRLLGSRGGHLDCACDDFGPQALRLKVKPGRYFVVVRSRGGSNGRYTLSRLARTITKTRVAIDGRHQATSAPGQTVAIGVRVTPGASGPVTVDVQRFDPVAGWQFFTRYKRQASGGSASVAFTPPSIGRWRVIATFDGTRRAAPSGPRRAELLVADPLTG